MTQVVGGTERADIRSARCMMVIEMHGTETMRDVAAAEVEVEVEVKTLTPDMRCARQRRLLVFVHDANKRTLVSRYRRSSLDITQRRRCCHCQRRERKSTLQPP
jgi:hypothetical protein